MYSHVIETYLQLLGVMQVYFYFVCRILRNMQRSYLPCSTDLVNLSRKLSVMTHDSLQQEIRFAQNSEIFVDIKGPLPLVCFHNCAGSYKQCFLLFSSNCIYSSTCPATLLHCKLKPSVAHVTTFVNNLPRSKMPCCKSAIAVAVDFYE